MSSTVQEKFFISKAGSRVRVFGEHLGAYEIDWDWFEEGVCVEAHPHFNMDFKEPEIMASCECCPDSPWTIRLKEDKKMLITDDQKKRELYWCALQNLVSAIDAVEECVHREKDGCASCGLAITCQKKSMHDCYLSDAREVINLKRRIESRKDNAP